MAKSASKIARTIQILIWRIRIVRSLAQGLHAVSSAATSSLASMNCASSRQRQPPQAVTRKVPTVCRLRPLARVEQVASVGQITELILTGRSWTKGSIYGGPISAPGA